LFKKSNKKIDGNKRAIEKHLQLEKEVKKHKLHLQQIEDQEVYECWFVEYTRKFKVFQETERNCLKEN
jgi:hypothetical protein